MGTMRRKILSVTEEVKEHVVKAISELNFEEDKILIN